MRLARLTALMLLAAAPAVAQPFIIPLEAKPKQVGPPVAFAPPVAPPIAAPHPAQIRRHARKARAVNSTMQAPPMKEK